MIALKLCQIIKQDTVNNIGKHCFILLTLTWYFHYQYRTTYKLDHEEYCLGCLFIYLFIYLCILFNDLPKAGEFTKEHKVPYKVNHPTQLVVYLKNNMYLIITLCLHSRHNRAEILKSINNKRCLPFIFHPQLSLRNVSHLDKTLQGVANSWSSEMQLVV